MKKMTIMIWLENFISDLKIRDLRLKDLFKYSISLFFVVFCRYKYFIWVEIKK